MTRPQYEFEMWQDGIMVVKVGSSTWDEALREITRYMAIYSQDGELRIRSKHAKELFAHIKPGNET